MASSVGIRELLEAGVHFGHQTRRWNPKMRRYIHGEREGIYIIDLLKTERLLGQAQTFVSGVARRGGTVLFVGTKKQARDSVKEIAESCGMPYVNHRWLGGLLTNFQTISQRIKRLHDLERYEAEGQLQLLPTQERMAALADLAKLRANLGGVKNMQRAPDAVLVVDLKTEAIAVKEAQRLRIPLIGLVDTNCDPDGIDYVIPGNDDAIKSCGLILRAIGDTISEHRAVWQRAEEERLAREAEEARRRAEEEEARKRAEQEAMEAAERVEDRQGEAAATPKANQGMERTAAGVKPQPAPTVAEDLPPRATARGKKRRPDVTAEDLAKASGPGGLPGGGPTEPAKAHTPVSPASAKRTKLDKEALATPGATETDPTTTEDPAAAVQAAETAPEAVEAPDAAPDAPDAAPDAPATPDATSDASAAADAGSEEPPVAPEAAEVPAEVATEEAGETTEGEKTNG